MAYEYVDLNWKFFKISPDSPISKEKISIEEDENGRDQMISQNYLFIPIKFFEQNQEIQPYFTWNSRNHTIFSWFQQENSDYVEIDFPNPRGIDFLTQLEEKCCHILHEYSAEWFKKKLTILQLDQLMRSCLRWNGKYHQLNLRCPYKDFSLFPCEIRNNIKKNENYNIVFRIQGMEVCQESWNLLIEIMDISLFNPIKENPKWINLIDDLTLQNIQIPETFLKSSSENFFENEINVENKTNTSKNIQENNDSSIQKLIERKENVRKKKEKKKKILKIVK